MIWLILIKQLFSLFFFKSIQSEMTDGFLVMADLYMFIFQYYIILFAIW